MCLGTVSDGKKDESLSTVFMMQTGCSSVPLRLSHSDSCFEPSCTARKASYHKPVTLTSDSFLKPSQVFTVNECHFPLKME